MKKKYFIKAIVFILVMAMILPNMLKTVEAADVPTYISEVKVGYSQDNSSAGSVAAKKSLTDEGFTVVDNDLNNGTGKGWSYIGYKTTKDKKEAITDLSIMDMGGGYSMNDYSKTLSKYNASIKEQGAGLLAAAKETKTNYEKGSPAAEMSLKTLNYMIVEGNNSQPLGEYLLSNDRTEEDFYNIVLKCDPKILTFIYSQLSLGVADYDSKAEIEAKTAKGTWFDRLSNMDPNKEYDDGEYYDKAMVLYPTIQKFATEYAEAVEATSNFKDEMIPEEKLEKPIETPETPEDPSSSDTSPETKASTDTSTPPLTSPETEDNALKDSITTPKSEEKKTISERHLMLRTIYNLLNEKQYNGVGIGDLLTDTDIYATDLYPLLDALTEGQRTVLAATGIESLTTNIMNNTDKAEGAKEDALAQIEKNAEPIKGVDLWWGVNIEAYDREVGMTSNAIRNSTAKNQLDALTKTDVTRENFDKSLEIVGGIAGAAFAVVTTAWFVMSAFYGATFSFSTIIGTMGGLWTAGIGSSIATGIFGGGVVVLAMAVIALLCIGFYYMITAIIDSINYYNPVYTDIPLEMYDYFEDLPDPENDGALYDKYIKYDAVTDQSGKAADLNTWQGLKWNALYSTKDPDAGNPILAHTFMVKQGDGTTNHGYSPLKKFGEVVSYNTNNHVYSSSAAATYIFFMREGGDRIKEVGTYITDLAVYEDATESNALAQLTTKGFTPIMVNLISNTERYAYMGYKTGKNPDNALVDIRIATNYDVASFFIGEGSYTKCGSYQNTTLYYTKKSAAAGFVSGDPILAEKFEVRYNAKESVPAGYEGISLISGGPAANMCIGSEPRARDIIDWNNINDINNKMEKISEKVHRIFMYYKSSVTYDTGPDYISGISYFKTPATPGSRFDKVDRAITDLELSGYTYAGQNMSASKIDSDAICMGYSTTKNPKRALKKVYTYYADAGGITMPNITVVGGIGYVAAAQYWGGKATNVGHTDYYGHSINTSNSYISNNGTSAMYVTSGTSQGAPFTRDEMIFSEKPLATVKDGYYPVSNLMDYSFSAADIKKGNNSSQYLYLYLPGTKALQKKYISSVVIGGAQGGAAYSRLDLFANGAEQALDYSASGNYYDLNNKEAGAERITPKEKEGYYSSIGFTRTDKIAEAITDIKIVIFNEKSSKATQGPPDTVKINKSTYTLASDKPFTTYRQTNSPLNLNFTGAYVYTTTNPDAGKPIIDAVVDYRQFLEGYKAATVNLDVPNSVPLTLGYQDVNTADKIYFKRVDTGSKYIYSIDARMSFYHYDAKKKIFDDGFMGVVNGEKFNYSEANFNAYSGALATTQSIMMGYNKTDDPDEAITGLMTLNGSNANPPATVARGNATYTIIDSWMDFNSTAGGEYVYLYYTKDPSAGSPITELRAQAYDPLKGSDWEVCMNDQWVYSNFNSSTDCTPVDGVFLSFKRANGVVSNRPSTLASIFIEPTPLMAVGLLIIMLGTGATLILIQERRKRKAIAGKE